jgi:hypothetical protein
MTDSKPKAGADRLNHLHNIVTESLIERIEGGEATAAEMKAATDWLTRNDVTGVATPQNPLGRLHALAPKISVAEVQRSVAGGR